jgi:very-short-patch-repair endonuclease
MQPSPGQDHVPVPPRLLRFAREMRHEPTDAEKKIWRRLRDRQFSGFKFRRQVPFGDFILDFFCVEAMLAIEIDGGQHKDAPEAEYDQGRDQALGRMGVLVLRFWADEALRDTDAVLSRILETLTARISDVPSPPPSPGGRGS